MTVRVIRLPDVGEGVAEAELVAWHVAVGDDVTSETVLAEVLTDKATIEVSAPVAGTVTFLRGDVGDVLAVGSDLVGIEVHGTRHDDAVRPDGTAAGSAAGAGAGESVGGPPAAPPEASDDTAIATVRVEHRRADVARSRPQPRPAHARGGRPVAAPAVRRRATELGVDLRLVDGSGPAGRITHTDLDAYLADSPAGLAPRAATPPQRPTVEVPIVGLRRKIAERLSTSVARIPHITYVEEVDVGAVDGLRHSLNTVHPDSPRLTLLPFLLRAIVLAVADQPHLNATFDDVAGVLTAHGPVHAGIATQTDDGLLVPVVRDADRLDLWATAAEIARLTDAARRGRASREELGGSTITITSLGALGGLMSTPIINYPEVAIVGINKMQIRPVWHGEAFVPRTMMNLSSSFDHRVVDGWDAATFVQRLKELLESPALLFIAAPQHYDPPEGHGPDSSS